MMRWLSSITAPITVPRVGVCLQAVMVSFVVLSAFVAYSSWRAEAGKRQTDATLRYFDPLMDRVHPLPVGDRGVHAVLRARR